MSRLHGELLQVPAYKVTGMQGHIPAVQELARASLYDFGPQIGNDEIPLSRYAEPAAAIIGSIITMAEEDHGLDLHERTPDLRRLHVLPNRPFQRLRRAHSLPERTLGWHTLNRHVIVSRERLQQGAWGDLGHEYLHDMGHYALDPHATKQQDGSWKINELIVTRNGLHGAGDAGHALNEFVTETSSREQVSVFWPRNPRLQPLVETARTKHGYLELMIFFGGLFRATFDSRTRRREAFKELQLDSLAGGATLHSGMLATALGPQNAGRIRQMPSETTNEVCTTAVQLGLPEVAADLVERRLRPLDIF